MNEMSCDMTKMSKCVTMPTTKSVAKKRSKNCSNVCNRL